ncbi:membrane-spanning 4-domains subfamily A member 15-like [Tiliqua scincoides]|uniref:membrane-spanning 4-domains subfamily A member 15-like n=1 Tax=Tiliqua scincoides TaxID=71010 RepID=UPI0034625F4B
MATTVTESGNVRIITQVVQPGAPQAAESVIVSPSLASRINSTPIKSIKSTLTKALGVVQIVLGVTHISFGIALTAAQEDQQTLTVKSGVYFWIGVLLLVSGSLLVEIENRERVSLMKISFAINFVIIVAALVAIVLHGVEIAQRVKKGTVCVQSHYSDHCFDHSQRLTYGLNAVFIILSVLELSIAVTALMVGVKFTRQQLYRQLVL